ncbi:Uma2 family endonuclease [Scytonema millei]|uniref:Uma2 family endonuclease n=1 Tax=Scytonema millei VB511283 TaxID=1245923 RepID=A0A9X5I695_9CYAN|nr:Uma2 family endonuclease [Scytonema millei]NHC36886.1 Uma2 family endonuclease [Scytonema millei VB511283]
MTAGSLDNFYVRFLERKLELIDNRLIVSNTIAGSRLLLWQSLQGWGAAAAVALAPIERWIEALFLGFEIPITSATSNVTETLDYFQTQITGREYDAEDFIAQFCGGEYEHNHIRQQLTFAFWKVKKLMGGECMGRDFVMRLGDNGFTPDLLFFTSTDRNQLYSWYLGGPAELVVEVLHSGYEDVDRIVKRDYYAAAGVPEYWIFDPQAQQVEFKRWHDGSYQQQFPDSDGYYRPSSIPDLAFCPTPLWREEDCECSQGEREMFILEASQPPYQKSQSIDDGLGWGCLPFAPILQLEPTPISFEQYICWCPEAKFEFADGKIQIGGDMGIRNLIGLLLMTFGLANAVKVLPLQAWIGALQERVGLEQQDNERKAAWWRLARQAAALLRENYGVTRVGVIGDLVRSQPLSYWSDITLVAWDVPRVKSYEIYQEFCQLSQQPKLRLLKPDDFMTVEEKQAVVNELVEI